ncbi:MAG: hypothetical protein E7564_08890 [Ruminococcaceae bacterium]|nr:hypothetical protein [Oscillospiraceae bacterium]
MKCPYCQKEMEKGLIHSPHELNFIKGEKRKFMTASFLHDNSVVLSKLSYLKGSATIAYNCPECEIIIIDYKNGKNDLNNK